MKTISCIAHLRFETQTLTTRTSAHRLLTFLFTTCSLLQEQHRADLLLEERRPGQQQYQLDRTPPHGKEVELSDGGRAADEAMRASDPCDWLDGD